MPLRDTAHPVSRDTNNPGLRGRVDASAILKEYVDALRIAQAERSWEG
jgi:hypothetical protein